MLLFIGAEEVDVSLSMGKISPVTRQLLPRIDKRKFLRHQKTEIKICSKRKSIGLTMNVNYTTATNNIKLLGVCSPETGSWHTECLDAFDNECCSNKRSNAGHGSHR